MDIEQRRANRLKLLLRLYELTGGLRHKSLPLKSVAQELGLDDKATEDADQYLKDQGLIEYQAFGPQVALTHAGITEVEERLGNPEASTARFPAAVNIINVGQMIGSQIHQGTTGSSVSSLAGTDGRAVSALVDALDRALREAQLRSLERSDVEAELATLRAQLKSTSPKPSILKESLETLKTLIQAGGQVAAAKEVIEKLLSILR